MNERRTLIAAVAASPLMFAPAGPPSAPLSYSTLEGLATVARARDIGRGDTDPLSMALTSTPKWDGFASQGEADRAIKNLMGQLATRLRLDHEINSLLQLEADWDDRGAVAPSKATVSVAREFARGATAAGFPPVRTYLSATGEIGLVWEKDSGYADVSIRDDKTVLFYIRDASGSQERFSDRRISIAELPSDFWTILSTL